MKRLTDKNEQGNWNLKGVPWENLREGHTLTKDDAELLYAALWKLMRYEDSGLDPGRLEEASELYREKCEEVKRLDRERPIVFQMPQDKEVE